MIKAVIFDMDGVIIDSEPIHSRSLALLLEEHAITPVYQQTGLIHTVGLPGDETYTALIEEHKMTITLDEFKEKRRNYFEEILHQGVQPMRGFKKLITSLKKNNIRLALASNRNQEHVILTLKKIKGETLFEAIVSPSKTTKPKPHPDIYLQAAKDLGVKPKDCVAIEDSETGVLAADTAKMKVIAVPNTYTAHQDFSKADTIVNSLEDISISLLKHL